MAKFVEKLWNWGHLEGSHNRYGFSCSMTPEQFAEEYGIKNAFIVSYAGNIVPPFDGLADRLSCLDNIKWSALGDASTPLPDDRLGNTNDVIAAAENHANITGSVVDDFFSPKRMERFTPEVLKEMKAALNAKGLDFWCVLYDMQLDMDLAKYMECFDGITFWIWESKNIANMDEYLEKLFKITGDKPVMLGIYLWDYSGNNMKGIPTEVFAGQLKKYTDLVMSKKIEGIIFCSGCIGDAELDTNKFLKNYIAKFGDTQID